MYDPVVMTGAGLVSSLGLTVSETWDALCSGKSGIWPISDFDAGGFSCRVAAQTPRIDPADLDITPRDARIMDKHSFLLLKCTQDAHRQAAIVQRGIAAEETGFFAGMGMVDHRIEDLLPALLKSRDKKGNLDYERFFSDGYQEIYPLWPLSMLNNISFCQAAIRLGIRGENAVFSPHADSGARAIAEAMEALIQKRTRVVLAGGVSEKISPSSLARAHLSNTLNLTGYDDSPACRPFGEDRRGTVLGEGCGVVALELKSSADEHGIPYRAMISGYGSSFGIEQDHPAPTKEAIIHAMRRAMEKAERDAETIDVVVANGDGTNEGDANEIKAIQEVFADRIDTLSVYSSKSALGNTYAAAPVIDIILALQIIEQGVLPRVLAPEPMEKGISFLVGRTAPVMRTTACIMVNCQSYEGQCASLIIEALEP